MGYYILLFYDVFKKDKEISGIKIKLFVINNWRKF